MRGFLCEQASSDVARFESNTDETTAHSYDTPTEGFQLVLPPSQTFDGAAFECPLCFFHDGCYQPDVLAAPPNARPSALRLYFREL